MAGSKKARHYVNNKDFLQALIDYKARCAELTKRGKPLPIIPDYIGVCIEMICRRLSLKGNFLRYTFNEELIGDGIIHCCAAVNKFNPDKGTNPFAYFTSIAWHAFVRRIEMEAAQNYTKHINLEHMLVFSDEFYAELENSTVIKMSGDGKTSGDKEGLQKHFDVIRNFEAKQARKKEKTRQASLNKQRGLTKRK